MNNSFLPDKMQSVSFFRVSSMFLIILFHSMCFYTRKWWPLCADMVPVWKYLASPIVEIGLSSFVFISGFLYGYMYIKGNKYRIAIPFLIKKFRRLMVPYFFWGIVMILLFPPLNIPWLSLFTGVAHLWFLLMLFLLFVIMTCIMKCRIIQNSTEMMDTLIVTISFGILYIWKYYSTHPHAFAIEETLYYFPSFLSGFYCAKYFNRYVKVTILYIFISVGIMVVFTLPLLGYFDSCPLYRIPSILIVVSSFLIFKESSFTLCQSKFFKILEINSMGIFIFNQMCVFLLLLIPTTNNYLRIHFYLGVFIIFVVSLIIPCFISILFHKVRYLSSLIG